MMWGNDGMGGGGRGSGGWAVPTLVMLAFWAVRVSAVIAASAAAGPTSERPGQRSAPLRNSRWTNG